MNNPDPRDRSLVGWMRRNRNLVLFLALVGMIVLMPLYTDDRAGEVAFAVVNMCIISVSALTNGSWRRLYWAAVALAAGALLIGLFALSTQRDWFLIPAWSLAALVHLLSIVRLVDEIFRAERITRDHLFACTSAYLLIGVAWCYLYALLQLFDPGALSGFGAKTSLHPASAMYFSFNIITSVALTDVLPTTAWARMLVLLQELASVLYMAFIISRLVGQYAPAAPAR